MPGGDCRDHRRCGRDRLLHLEEEPVLPHAQRAQRYVPLDNFAGARIGEPGLLPRVVDEALLAAAVELANATPFGLASYFYTENVHRAWRVAERLALPERQVACALDERGENEGAVRRAEQRIDRVLGVRHQAEHIARIVENAGEDAAVILNQVKAGKGAYGYNAATGVIRITISTSATSVVADRAISDEPPDDPRGAGLGRCDPYPAPSGAARRVAL